MSNITVSFKNHVHVKVDADPSIAQEMNEYFSFDVPGAKFTPLYRSKMWDGKVRLYSLMTKELYVGLLGYLRKFAEENAYTIDESNYNKSGHAVTYEEVVDFCNNLNLGSKGEPLLIREYQLDAIYQAIIEGRRLLLSPTGSGKSLIIYCLIRWHETFGRRQLIIVPTTSLVEQMYSDFQDYSCLNGWKTVEHCHKIYGGSEKSNDYDVVISTWQSIYKLPKQFFAEFQTMFGDEAHLFKSKSLTTIFNKCTNTPYRIGTTGTLDGTKTHKLILEGLFGPLYKVITTKQLIDSNQLANLKIYSILLEYPDEIRKSVKTLKYQEEMDFLVTNDARNKFIRNLAIYQKGNTLVLFQYVEKHGKMLFDMIESKTKDRRVFFVFGGTETAQREEIRHIVEKESDAIIVASYGTFSTGINIRNLHNIIFASPSKSRIRNLQSIGRGLRLGESKDTCKLYDIGDNLSWKSRKNYTLLHMIERIKIYNDEHLDYKLAKVPLYG
ncbi:DEAD/DEAH box helicase [bacterium]|nr:DEAD/DEAH box helicase [bacterium]